MSAAVQDHRDAATTELLVSVTPDEAELIARMADKAGLSVGAFLRRQALTPISGSPEEAFALQVMDELLEGMHRNLDRAIGALDSGLSRMEAR